MRKAFDESELSVVGMHKCGAGAMMENMGAPVLELEPIFNRPITMKENFKLAFSKEEGVKPYWKPLAGWMCCDVNNFRPRIIPDNVATRLVFDGEEKMDYPSLTAKGWFDLDWVFVPIAGGATVQPGSPKLTDMNDWGHQKGGSSLWQLQWRSMYLITSA